MKNEKVLTLVEGAVMVALATVLSFVKIVHLPWGGSITLLSMLPIIVFSIKRGVANGLAASFVFALIQFIQGCADGLFGWGLTPVALVACIFIDYILHLRCWGLREFQKIRNARSDWRKRYGHGSAPCVPLYKRSADIRFVRGTVERLYRKRALPLQPAL